MDQDKIKRKLAAILSVDVKDYSRLMGEDEEGNPPNLEGSQRDDNWLLSTSPGPGGWDSRK